MSYHASINIPTFKKDIPYLGVSSIFSKTNTKLRKNKKNKDSGHTTSFYAKSKKYCSPEASEVPFPEFDDISV